MMNQHIIKAEADLQAFKEDKRRFIVEYINRQFQRWTSNSFVQLELQRLATMPARRPLSILHFAGKAFPVVTRLALRQTPWATRVSLANP